RVLQENVIERLGSNRSVAIDIRVIAATNRAFAVPLNKGRFPKISSTVSTSFTSPCHPFPTALEILLLLPNPLFGNLPLGLGRGRPTLSAAALARLQSYAWPGNVRELENVIERALVLSRGEQIEVQHLPRELVSAAELAPPLVSAAPSQPLSLIPAVENLEK